MNNINLEKPIVSVDWLHGNINASNLIVLDASMKKATDTDADSTKIQIPNARYFDIKNVFSNTSDEFPNAVPSEEQFTLEAQNIGINKDSAIVVYDDKGIYSSARVWWLFKAFGYDNIAVLDGGLPEWLISNYKTEIKQEHETDKGDFTGTYNVQYFKFFEEIIGLSQNNEHLILDARSADRFNGLVEEPREGLRSGHIPNSKNLPYTVLFEENKMKTAEDLNSIFNNFNVSDKNLVFSCGSGITACILALGADIAGYKNLTVYDGSWTEFGTLTNTEDMEGTIQWTKNELVAYILLYASQSDMIESNKERNIIISKVDMKTFQKIHNEFDKDNDYQSIQKIIEGLKAHHYTKMDVDLLLADIKLLFFADGNFNISERTMFKLLKKLLQK